MIKESIKEKVGNMRALGEVEIQGEKVEVTKIIRSNVPINLSEDDITYLKEIGIKNVIDLRNLKEQKSKISCFENRSDFNVYHISLPNGDKIPKSVEDVPKSYIDMLEAKKEIKSIFSILLKGEGILYFCNAGKDRTGVISILILMTLGVPEKLVCADYLKTNDYLYQIIKANNFSKEIIDIITPKKEYVEKFYSLFKQKYISIEQYLQAIDIDYEELNKIRSNYLKTDN